MISFPEIYSFNKYGKRQCWKIHVCENYYFTETYLDENHTKHRFSNKIFCTGKNRGKINETTPEQQAYLEASMKWKKKNESVQTLRYLPMLAHHYQDRGQKYLNEPFAVSPKLDGIRALAHVPNRDVELYSRNGKVFPFLKHIKEQLDCFFEDSNIVLDGELYTHEIPFNELSGIIRSRKTPSIRETDIQYWIFDLLSNEPYRQRIELLRSLYKKYSERYTEYRAIRLVDCIQSTHSTVQEIHTRYVKDGFEGLIARNFDQSYEIGFRSNHLLKYKEFEEDEFEIIGYKLGVDGGIVFECKDSEYTFHVRPRGSIEYRARLYQLREEHIGKKLTVRYQNRDPVPRFPVGISIRDYE